MILISVLIIFFSAFLGQVNATVPVFTDILVPINVREDVTTETLLDTFTVTDPDGGNITVCSHTGDTGEFDLRQLASDNTEFELYLVAGANLEYDTTPSFTLVVTCYDSGGESAAQNIQIDIVPNQPPTITPPTSSVTVDENEVAQTLLYTITVTDVEGDTIICDVQSTSPSSSVFGVWSTTDYGLYILANPSLAYSSAATYVVTLVCSDNFGSSTTDVTVDVVPNQAPTFDNLPVSISVDATASPIGTYIYTVTASDVDSTALTYSMTSLPLSPDVFSINAASGQITVSTDLLYAVDVAYALTVTVDDTKATATDVLTVILTNVNSAPVITNLPAVVTINENSNSGTTVYTTTATDADGDSTTMSLTASPLAHLSSFQRSASYSVRTTAVLDYELQTTYTLYVSITDDKASTGPYTLTVNVIDVNEQCAFSADTYHVTMYEALSGSGTVTPGFVVTDEDIGDVYSLTLTSNTYSSYFSMNTDTGDISFAVDYDVDVTHPTNATLTAVCTDTLGLTGTATVSVTILDANDNAPVFSKPAYLKYINQGSIPADIVDKLTATDADSGLNGKLEYSYTSLDTLGTQYIHITPNGVVLVKDYTSSLSYGDVFRFVLYATDKGSPSLTGSTTVEIMYKYVENVTTTSTTTTTAATTSQSFWDEPGNVGVVVTSVLLGAIVLGLVAYLLWRYCIRGSAYSKFCKTKPKTTKVKPKPNPGKKKFDFWNKKSDAPDKNNQTKTSDISATTMPQPFWNNM